MRRLSAIFAIALLAGAALWSGAANAGLHCDMLARDLAEGVLTEDSPGIVADRKFCALERQAETMQRFRNQSARPALPSVDARNGGFAKLRDYDAAIPRLTSEQLAASEGAKKFSGIAGDLASNHEAQARTLASQAASLEAKAAAAGAIPGDDGNRTARSEQPPAPKAPIDGDNQDSGSGTGGDLSLANGQASPASGSGSGGVRETATTALMASGSGTEPRVASGSPREASAGHTSRISVADAEAGNHAPASVRKSSEAYVDRARARTGSRDRKPGSALRDALRRSMTAPGKGEPEAGSGPRTGAESAVFGLLHEAGSAADRVPASAGGPGSQAFSMSDSETAAEIRRMSGNGAQSSDIPGAETAGLFQRIHLAHARAVKAGTVFGGNS
jgi:hypothetical protein